MQCSCTAGPRRATKPVLEMSVNIVWIVLLFAVLAVGFTNAQEAAAEPVDVVEQLIENGADVQTSLIVEEFGAEFVEQQEEGEEEDEVVVAEFQPTPTPIPIPTPTVSPVCLSTAQSNIECGASRSRALYDFVAAVDPRAVQTSVHSALYACVATDRLAAACDRIFASEGGREVADKINRTILPACESVKHPGYVCVRDLEVNQCQCVNSCEDIQTLLSARRILSSRSGGRH